MLSLRVLTDPISEMSWCLTRRRVWWDSFDSMWNGIHAFLLQTRASCKLGLGILSLRTALQSPLSAPCFSLPSGIPKSISEAWTCSQSWSQAEVHRLQQQPWLGLLAGLPCFRAVPAAVLPSQKGPFVASQSKVRLAPGMHATVQSLMLFSSRIPTRIYSYQHYWFVSLWGASDGLSSPGYKQSHTEPPKLP